MARTCCFFHIFFFLLFCSPAIASTCPNNMVKVSASWFFQGSKRGKLDEVPVRKRWLRSFCLDKTEVTVQAYKKCIKAGKCHAFRHKALHGIHPSRPIAFVTWLDAKKFCTWNGKRLPSEAEWERAAKGTSQHQVFPTGKVMSCKKANYGALRSYSCRKGHPLRTKKVGSFSAGNLGLFDMAGNVAEWVEDCYSPSFYKKSRKRNPVFKQCKKEDARVIRGGSFASPRTDLRSSSRQGVHPALSFSDVGFRCAKSIP